MAKVNAWKGADKEKQNLKSASLKDKYEKCMGNDNCLRSVANSQYMALSNLKRMAKVYGWKGAKKEKPASSSQSAFVSPSKPKNSVESSLPQKHISIKEGFEKCNGRSFCLRKVANFHSISISNLKRMAKVNAWKGADKEKQNLKSASLKDKYEKCMGNDNCLRSVANSQYMALSNLKRMAKVYGWNGTRLTQKEYQAIIKASEDTAGCGFLSFGCEDPLKMPNYDSDFHLKHYRRVKVYANRFPWIGSEIELEKGDQVLVLASGKVTTCAQCGTHSIDLPPNKYLYMSIGESRNFRRYYGKQAGEGSYRDSSAQGSGELQFAVRDWDTYPPPRHYYSDNSGSFLLDVFVYDKAQEEGFKQLLRTMAKQNPEDSVFTAQARAF